MKYLHDAAELFKQAKKIYLELNLSINNKKELKEMSTRKLKKELIAKEYIIDKKFDIIGEEINKALKELELT